MQTVLPVMPNLVEASFDDLNLEGKASGSCGKSSNIDDFSRGEEQIPFSAFLGINNDQISPDTEFNAQFVLGKGGSITEVIFVNNFKENTPPPAEHRNFHLGKSTSQFGMPFQTSTEEQFHSARAIKSQLEIPFEQTSADIKGDLSKGELLSSLKLNPQTKEQTIKEPPTFLSLDDSASKAEKNTLDLKEMSEKLIRFDKDSTSIKAPEFGSSKNEDSQSFLNGHSSQAATDIFASEKEAEASQKSLQNQILTQIVEKAVLSLKNGQNEIKIDLKPEFLGHLRMQITTDNQQVTLKILTDIPIAKEIIESNIHHLKAALQSHGLKMEEIDVFVSHDSNQFGGGHWSNEFRKEEIEFEKNEKVNGFESEESAETIRPGAERTGLILIDFFA